MNLECRRKPIFIINAFLIFCFAESKVVSLSKTHSLRPTTNFFLPHSIPGGPYWHPTAHRMKPNPCWRRGSHPLGSSSKHSYCCPCRITPTPGWPLTVPVLQITLSCSEATWLSRHIFRSTDDKTNKHCVRRGAHSWQEELASTSQAISHFHFPSANTALSSSHGHLEPSELTLQGTGEGG